MAQSKFQIARVIIARMGGRLTRKDGEYRVTVVTGNSREYQEAIAYYSDNLDDIIQTFDCMVKEQK